MQTNRFDADTVSKVVDHIEVVQEQEPSDLILMLVRPPAGSVS